MKLYFRPDAPSDRKIVVAAIEAGIEGRIETIPVEHDLASDLLQETPVGQVPVLVRDDGARVVGSVSICEYLDSLHERPKLMPDKGEARLEIQQLEAFADELLRAAIARDRELSRPPALRWEDEAARQKRRIERILETLERLTNTVLVGPVTLGHIAVGCALGWLDSRLAEEGWRKECPALAEWYDCFRQRPSMQATEPAAAMGA